MEIRRTANAGVLLNLDGVSILLDGVCREVGAYLATPPALLKELLDSPPDKVLFTHTHADHYCQDFARRYADKTGLKIALPAGERWTDPAGTVQITALPTRHMGRGGLTDAHQSFVIQGSRCVWFLGDASPTELKKLDGFPRPDVLTVPYPYISTPSALRLVENLLPCNIILLHLPRQEHDPEGIWQAMAPGMAALASHLRVLSVGQTVKL